MNEQEKEPERHVYSHRKCSNCGHTEELTPAAAHRYQLELLLMITADCAMMKERMRTPLVRMYQQGHETEKYDLCLCIIDTNVNTMIRYIHSDLHRLGVIK